MISLKLEKCAGFFEIKLMTLPEIELKILKFWQKNKIFEKSISQRKGRPFFSFYDGPPFASGEPHYGHILASAIKDAVLRYWSMRGYSVPRRVGWDCHGLPVENLIEKELGIKTKKDIEKEVYSKVPLLLKGGGYIPAVDHSVPPDVSFENYSFFIDLIRSMTS